METDWVAKRLALWKLLQEPVHRSDAVLARSVGASRSWVQKWRPRLHEANGTTLTPFLSRSRRRKTSPRQVSAPLEAKILHLREHLTEQYQRKVGARNILYHLHQDDDLKRLKVFIPRSASTVHDVLVRFGRIPRPGPRIHVPREPAEPMQVWEMDFTDVVTAQSPDTGKRQHQVEIFNVVDTGSSVVLETLVGDCCDAEWALAAIITVFESVGLPRVLRFDRDPRFVTSWSADGFPSALMRLLLCLGVEPDICPPHRPDLKPYVERFIRTQKEECIYPQRPPTVVATQQCTIAHSQFYNLERPNQALTCGNRPPSLALGAVPRLPRLPETVDPDAWLKHYHRHSFRRQIPANGSVRIGSHSYYIRKDLAGQRALLVVDADRQQFDIWVGREHVKSRPIRGLIHEVMPFGDYADYIVQEARSEEKRLQQKRRRRQLA